MLIIDFHVHLGYAVSNAKSTEKGILRSLKDAGVSKAVVFPTKSINRSYQYRTLNKKVMAFYEANPDLIIPFIRLKPGFTQNELEAYDNIKGVKIHLSSDGWTMDKFRKALLILKNTNLLVLFHSTSDLIKKVTPIIKEFNSIKFIAAHGTRNKNYLDAFKTCANLYLDTSIRTSPFALKILANIDEDRILFGSDYPFSTPKIERLKIELTPEEYLAPLQKEKILGLNAKKLLNI